ANSIVDNGGFSVNPNLHEKQQFTASFTSLEFSLSHTHIMRWLRASPRKLTNTAATFVPLIR
ncbi:hypothetical protein BaRGS_00021336, partial [Batillaria attramentaria]